MYYTFTCLIAPGLCFFHRHHNVESIILCSSANSVIVLIINIFVLFHFVVFNLLICSRMLRLKI